MIKKMLRAVWGVVLTFGFMCFMALLGTFAVNVRSAAAHTASPAMVTFQAGAKLTAADLNNALAHIHNTLSGGITDANLSTSAAIAHTKLATPALVPKASAVVTANCDGAAAAGTDCTFTSISNVTAVSAQGTAGGGIYCVDLAYAPANTVFVVNVTSHTATAVCIATDRNAGSACGADTYNFYVRCFDYAGAAVNNVQFGFTVMDDNSP